MSNYAVGHAAEKYAAEYLQEHGYKVLDLNWRTKFCEIDIVAKRDKVVCFFEVKYRKNDFAGRGLEYITKAKQKQMQFAAEMWVQEKDWSGDYEIGAIEVSGTEYRITEFLTQL